jgi:hypothetical protein
LLFEIRSTFNVISNGLNVFVIVHTANFTSALIVNFEPMPLFSSVSILALVSLIWLTRIPLSPLLSSYLTQFTEQVWPTPLYDRVDYEAYSLSEHSPISRIRMPNATTEPFGHFSGSW